MLLPGIFPLKCHVYNRVVLGNNFKNKKKQTLHTHINQCTYSASFSLKWPSGFVKTKVHNEDGSASYDTTGGNAALICTQ